MRFLFFIILFTIGIESFCFGSTFQWKELVSQQSFNTHVFVSESEKILKKFDYHILFSVRNDQQAAIFFTDHQMQDSGALILNHDKNQIIFGGISNSSDFENRIKDHITKIFKNKYSKYNLLFNVAYADNCNPTAKMNSFENLKSIVTEQEKNSYFAFASGCGKGLIEGAVSGTTGSAQAIFDLVKAAATLSGPAEAWEKIKNIPVQLVSIVKEFRKNLSEVLGQGVSLPSDVTGNLMCTFISEFGVRAIISALTGGGSLIAIFEGIKSFTAKIGKVAHSFNEGLEFKKTISSVSKQYQYIFNKLDSNFKIPNTQFDEKNLSKHFKKHQNDVGATSADDYAKKAYALAEKSDPDILVMKGPKSGAIFKYKPSTNEFLVVSKTGRIETYFKPNPNKHGLGSNLEYFLKQYELY